MNKHPLFIHINTITELDLHDALVAARKFFVTFIHNIPDLILDAPPFGPGMN
ncbi:hypothetical protein [Paenibacillus sedimenti]|uniref:Uncharacterized protein n=1 Tax=Paenibacillus sedimenti TaxID=2770274 RepID=A0A926KRT7_9BACL|nr:hypothetical protein [Paenibacillus sedimenti]MBD0382909.1 hypothetical protein [Paenibacillus sedimenti]